MLIPGTFVNDENKNIYSAKIDETLNAKMEALV